MEYRILGKTGLQISRMGFGGIPIQKTSAGQTKLLLQTLAQHGVNYIDTARGYTVSEEYIGYGLEGMRDRFVLATKSMARTREAMERDIAISLKNLRTDHIDLYQIHNPNQEALTQVMGPDGALEALQAAKAAGRIGHIGITLHSAELFAQALELDWVETIMFPYNIVETQAEDLIRRCEEKNIGFIDMKPLAGGAIMQPSVALRFVAANPSVTVLIPGVESVEQIHQNLAAISDPSPLTTEEYAAIDQIRGELGSQFCRRCNYCAPCTAGIHVPSVFMMEGYYSRYDLKEWALQRYTAMDKKASDCMGCGVCETRCPYGLPIRQMMKKAKEVLGA